MKILVLGAGVSGHTAAQFLRRKLSKEHEVIVMTPNSMWNWIPSNIWVGTGLMRKEDVTFELAPVYQKMGVTFVQAKATEIYPEGKGEQSRPFVVGERTGGPEVGQNVKVEYDYLINATGPKLNFEATPGLGPNGFTYSVCTFDHADETSQAFLALIQEMKQGHKKTIVVGTGHGTCTCEGAAFEFVFNLEFELRRHGVRDQARLIYLTNESELGDFGVGGMELQVGGYSTHSKTFTESLFVERNVDWILGAHVQRVEKDKIYYEDLTGDSFTLDYDFAMLLPPFRGVPLKAFDAQGKDLGSDLFNPGGFMKVDGNYTAKEHSDWEASDWPKTYQTRYPNIFSVGIAFAPPHPISEPRKNKNGTNITPSPPRTGMPSAIMGRAVAISIVEMIRTDSKVPTRTASMAELGAACVASAGAHIFNGTAAAITMYPIVHDYKKYPGSGRHRSFTTGEIGLAGHWIKQLLHYAFIYKAKGHPFWWVIPE